MAPDVSAKQQRKEKASGLEPSAVLRCTEKAGNAALLIQQRCFACHGLTVRDVIGSMAESGSRYSMADLKYDIKHGRLEVLPVGGEAGPLPVGKERKSAPCAGQPLPAASVDELLRFLQCQLRMELREHCGEHLELEDEEAEKMWPDVEAFVTPNLGATERWVPYHTVLGVHELFLVQSVHHRAGWTEKQKFQAMFIFRAHCKRDLFTQAQLPLLLNKTFWQDPRKAFVAGGPMEKAILKYRKDTGKPLITSCFRIIPPRVLKDDDENLVRSITDRTLRLLEVAELAFPILRDSGKGAAEKMAAISAHIQDAPGLGETWAKMLTVCIDLANPKEQLLESQCDVGTGAAPPLRCLVPKGDFTDKKQALKELLKVVNSADSKHADYFWATLKKQEEMIRNKFKAFPLVCAQANTQERGMSAVTLQVQLCEYRQFRHSIARLKYGLADDEAMRGEANSETRLTPENFVEMDKERQCVTFGIPRDGEKVQFDVDLAAAGDNEMVARRVAYMCFEKLRAGRTKEETEKFRDDLMKDYTGGEDVAPDSEAWAICRVSLTHRNPLVGFTHTLKGGAKFHFQTTKGAAGGFLQAERIARLCWVKLQSGASKEEALEYREELYRRRSSESQGGPPTKKLRFTK